MGQGTSKTISRHEVIQKAYRVFKQVNGAEALVELERLREMKHRGEIVMRKRRGSIVQYIPPDNTENYQQLFDLESNFNEIYYNVEQQYLSKGYEII